MPEPDYRRFGIRYGPYIADRQVRIRINSRDCQPQQPSIVEGSRRQVEMSAPGVRKMVGWIGLLERRSIKGDYGIHLYRHNRLISAFDKFGIRRHPDAARVVGEMSLDHVPVNFHKTGFLTESPEYQGAYSRFAQHPAVREVLRRASSHGRSEQDIRSVLSLGADTTAPLPPLDARMSSANSALLLRKAERFVEQDNGTTFSFEFDDSSACSMERVVDGLRIGIGRKSGAFRLFKNPLFLIALMRIEAQLASEEPSYQDFVRRRNEMLDKFIADRLPKERGGSIVGGRRGGGGGGGGGQTRRKASPLPGYALQGELIELHDHLQENFEHGFQFTGLSTLAPFLHNAYKIMIYSIHTINGAGQSLQEEIADWAKEFVVLLNPKRKEFEVLFEATDSDRFIAVREYEESPAPSWAGPEKAWLDMYFEVTRGILPIYHDELILVLGELLDAGLASPARLRSLARRRRISGEIETYLPGE